MLENNKDNGTRDLSWIMALLSPGGREGWLWRKHTRPLIWTFRMQPWWNWRNLEDKRNFSRLVWSRGLVLGSFLAVFCDLNFNFGTVDVLKQTLLTMKSRNNFTLVNQSDARWQVGGIKKSVLTLYLRGVNKFRSWQSRETSRSARPGKSKNRHLLSLLYLG